MPKPATFTPAEISALASRLREVWRPGSQITPWLRDNAERLTELNREERFSWAAVASALNEVGIVYRTGNPWTATNLAKAVSEVRPGGRANPTAERQAELAAWKAAQNSAKFQGKVETHRRIRNGFTLIEMLVALVILGIAMGVIVGGLHSAGMSVARTSEQVQSLVTAKSLLSAEGTALPLRYGETSGDTAGGDHWTISIKPWVTNDADGPPLMGAYWINIQVTHAGRTLDLTTLRPGPAPNAE